MLIDDDDNDDDDDYDDDDVDVDNNDKWCWWCWWSCACVQLVLFIGVTILLASTYVTLTTQEKLGKPDSVIKRAQPIGQHVDSDVFNLQLKQSLGKLLSAESHCSKQYTTKGQRFTFLSLEEQQWNDVANWIFCHIS